MTTPNQSPAAKCAEEIGILGRQFLHRNIEGDYAQSRAIEIILRHFPSPAFVHKLWCNSRIEQDLEYDCECNCKGVSELPADKSICGIIIPQRPPPHVIEALHNFVDSIEDYRETGVWPDNGTLRRLADEGADALQLYPRPPANEGLEAIATRIVKWKHSLTMSEVISALNQVVAKVTKERDEWKQICRNRDETVNKQGDEWVKLKTQIDQLLRDKEALQKVAKVCDSKISRVFAEADRGIEIAKQAILALTKTNK